MQIFSCLKKSPPSGTATSRAASWGSGRGTRSTFRIWGLLHQAVLSCCCSTPRLQGSGTQGCPRTHRAGSPGRSLPWQPGEFPAQQGQGHAPQLPATGLSPSTPAGAWRWPEASPPPPGSGFPQTQRRRGRCRAWAGQAELSLQKPTAL